MEFMLDTLNLEEIKKWSKVLPLAEWLLIRPSQKEGEIDFFKRIPAVREIIGGESFYPCSGCCQRLWGILKKMLLKFAKKCGEMCLLKVPVTRMGWPLSKLSKREVTRLRQPIYTTFQGLLAIRSGADYLAPYYNRNGKFQYWFRCCHRPAGWCDCERRFILAKF